MQYNKQPLELASKNHFIQPCERGGNPLPLEQSNFILVMIFTNVLLINKNTCKKIYVQTKDIKTSSVSISSFPFSIPAFVPPHSLPVTIQFLFWL